MNYKYNNISVEIQKVGLDEQECVDIILYDDALSTYDDINGSTTNNRPNAVGFVMYSKKDLDNNVPTKTIHDITWMIHSKKENNYNKILDVNLKNKEISENLLLEALIANEDEQITKYKRMNEVKFKLIAKKTYIDYINNELNRL